MTGKRLLVLTLGPPLLVGAAYALTQPSFGRAWSGNSLHIEQAERRGAAARANEQSVLAQACQHAADELIPQLPSTWTVIVRAPFVLAGDLGESELERWYGTAIQPSADALWRSYFDLRPNQPVTIVALSNEENYRIAAWNLDGYEPAAYSGYTQRARRRIVFDARTGTGTLIHELAHVLALFDFPEMPEWFDEGLATLHEEAVFSDDGLTLRGTANWRSRLLREALVARELPALESLIKTHSFRGEGEGLNYALVRGFCLYLQDRGLLAHFYRKLRAAVADDPSGLSTLCELLGDASTVEIDRDFHAWIGRQSAAHRE